MCAAALLNRPLVGMGPSATNACQGDGADQTPEQMGVSGCYYTQRQGYKGETVSRDAGGWEGRAGRGPSG